LSQPRGVSCGGGQPRITDEQTRLARIAAIYREDEGKPIRKSHSNPAIVALYRDFLGQPLGHKAHELLHTHYIRRSKYNESASE